MGMSQQNAESSAFDQIFKLTVGWKSMGKKTEYACRISKLKACQKAYKMESA